MKNLFLSINLIIAIGLMSTSSLKAQGDIWSGYSPTVSPNGEIGGYWYTFDDSLDGGTSSVVPNLKSVNMDELVANGSWLVAMTLGSEGTANPFAAIGFDWKGASLDGLAEPMDISAAASICVTYQSDAVVMLELIEEGNPGAFNNYSVPLLPNTAAEVKNIPFTEFAQELYWGTPYSLDLTLQVSVHFKYKGAGPLLGTTANLNIFEVGYDGSCEIPVSIGESRSFYSLAEGVKVTGENRLMLPDWMSFSPGNIEIFNTTGKKLSRKNIQFSGGYLTLSNVNPGIYFIQAGQFSQKIRLW